MRQPASFIQCIFTSMQRRLVWKKNTRRHKVIDDAITHMVTKYPVRTYIKHTSYTIHAIPTHLVGISSSCPRQITVLSFGEVIMRPVAKIEREFLWFDLRSARIFDCCRLVLHFDNESSIALLLARVVPPGVKEAHKMMKKSKID